MEWLNNLIDSTWVYSISITVLHSLWQGAVLVLLMNLYLKFHHNETSKFRYRVSFNTLLLLLISTLGTFGYYQFSLGQDSGFSTSDVVRGVATGAVGILSKSHSPGLIRDILPFVGLLWLVGAVVFLMKLIFGVLYIRDVKSSLITAVPQWLMDRLDILKSELDIDREIVLGISTKVISPLVVGCFKPMVIFPLATINRLSHEEIELILRHELGHIIRNDFIQNAIIRISEVVLFYHPGMWWINRMVERERENHCDEYAIEQSTDRLLYAKTLLKIKELELIAAPSMALAFSNNKKTLLERVSRILNQKQKTSFMKSNVVVLLLLVSSIICISAGSMYFNRDSGSTEKLETKSIKPINVEPRKNVIKRMIMAQDTSKEELKKMIKSKQKEIKEKEKERFKEMKKMRKELKDLKAKSGDDSYSIHIDSDDWDEVDWERFGEKMEDISDRLVKRFNNEEWEEKMERIGEKISERFENEEWEERMSNLGERISERFEDEKFEAKMEELGERLERKFNSEEWEEKMERIGEKLSEKMESGEFEAEMEELEERLEQTFGSEEFQSTVEDLAYIGADFGVGIAETALGALSAIVDSDDWHFEGEIDVSFDEDDWENIKKVVDGVLDQVDRTLEEIDQESSNYDKINLTDWLKSELKEDGFYKKEKVSLELNKGQFKINGKTQSNQIEDKYKDIIHDAFKVSKEDQLDFNYKFSDKKGNTKSSYSIEKEKRDKRI